jgi:uncharacterized protein (DUF4415 family)
MSTFVLVNMRLSPEELREYRRMALQDGKSFSTSIRNILRSYAKRHQPAKAAHDSV